MDRRRRLLGVIIVSVLALCVFTAIAFGGGSSGTRRTLTLQLAGRGTVLIGATGRVCHHVCRSRLAVPAKITLTARPSGGSHFVRWSGGCSNHPDHPRCVLRVRRRRTVVAHFAANPGGSNPGGSNPGGSNPGGANPGGSNSGLVSWNPYYKRCTPVLTTIPFILGSQQNASGGATEAGGGFQPHLSGPPDQHLLNPPCSIGGTSTFVEIHDVALAENSGRSADGDETMNMIDPNRPDIKNPYMKTIHTEIDHLLFEHGVAPPIPPPQGTHVDIQGFVFWDPAHVNAQFHSYSGWEIHTVTAWRRAAH